MGRDTNVLLRPAVMADVPALAEIWHEAWIAGHADHVPSALTEQRTVESFNIRLIDLVASTTVAGVGGEPAGFCCLRGAELYQIMVSASARGKGVAPLLMRDAVARVGAAGHDRIWLDCAVGNDRAAAFYRKSGWTLADTLVEHVATLGDPFPLEVWRFEKHL